MQRRDFLTAGTALGLTFSGIPWHVLAAGNPGGVLNACVQPEPPGLNPSVHNNAPVQTVGGNLYEGLLRYDENLQPQPCLAQSWDVSTDGLVCTFRLKPNVRWHDGKPFTADDVVFSADVFNRAMHPKARSNMAQMQSIRALDALTVEFRLKNTFGPLIDMFPVNALPIVPKHLYAGATELRNHPSNSQYIGTGPFKFKEWVKGSYIHLERFADYHETDLPLLDAIYFHIIPDAAARANAFESGKIDVLPAGTVEYFDVVRLSKLPGAAVTQRGLDLFCPQSHIILNNRKAPMDDVQFRRGLSLALDREAMRRIVWYGFADVASGPFNSRLKFSVSGKSLPKLAHDKAQARKLIAASGYRGQALNMMALPYGETWQRLAEVARQNFSDVGVKTTLVANDAAGWNAKMNAWDFDITFTYNQGHGDPEIGMRRLYTTANIAKGTPFNNVQGYSNPRVDTLFEQGAVEFDQDKRAQIYREIQEILVADMPVLWLHELNFPTLYRTRVNNIINSGAGINDSLARAWIA